MFFSDVKDERDYYNFQLLLVQDISQTHFSQEKNLRAKQSHTELPMNIYIRLSEAQHQIIKYR